MEKITSQDLRGGVKSILLMSAKGEFEAVFSSEGVTLSLPSEGTLSVTPDDNSALWSESLSQHDIIPRATHRLEFRIPHGHPAIELLRAPHGVIAVVELTCGKRLLGGYSERFGTEQPLRPLALKLTSGRTHEDDLGWDITLTSTDDTLAMNCILTD